jgi:YidC/Oxa1 family membrane protein insertase
MKRKLLVVLIGISLFAIMLTGCAGGVQFPKATGTGVIVQIAASGRAMQNLPLAVRITNNTNDFISDVTVKVVSIDGKTDFGDFKFVDASYEPLNGPPEVSITQFTKNKSNIIESGKAVTVVFNLTTYKYIDPRAYTVKVEVTYKDSNGKLHTVTQNGVINIAKQNVLYKWTRDLIEWFHHFIPNYGLDIILITILIKLAVHPLTRVQFKSTAGMQKIQPEINKLRQKYKDNPQKLNQEVMKVYKEHDVNMFGGCLPLLVQWPLLFVLFGALINYSPFNLERFLWLTNLNRPDQYYILPALVLVSMYLQTKTSQLPGQEMDQNTKMMMYFLPVIFAVWSIKWAPSILLYWVTFSFVQAAEQIYIIHILETAMEKPKSQKKLKDENDKKGK